MASPVKERQWPALKVEKRKVADLKKNPRNAKQHPPAQVDMIRKSIKQFGWTSAVLVDEHDVLIAGHARLDAATLEGIKEVPVIVARGWTEKEKLAYLEADNRLTELGGYDDDLRKSILTELAESGFDMEAVGWGGDELADFLAGPEAPAEFQTLGDDIPTEHQCPSCGYRWSGKFSGLVPAERTDGKNGAPAKRK